jgi:beta-mannanase
VNQSIYTTLALIKSRLLSVWGVLLILLVSILLLVGCAGGSQDAQPVGDEGYCNGSVALGAYIPGVREDPAKVDEFTTMVGTQPTIVAWYQNWDQSSVKEFNPELIEAVASRGAMPMVSWEPYNPTKGVKAKKQRKYAIQTIIAREHDAYIRRWARGVADWGKPMYLRFAHEMNSVSYPWSIGINDNTSAEYVSAWRHIVDVFREEGATNVRWVWSPTVALNVSPPFEEFYPGDDYVDWVALDGYNWGTTQSWSRWQTLAEVFGPSYDEVTALAPDKPFMIAETGSAEEGGDKAAWIREAFGEDLPTRLPMTKAVVWFNVNKEADWRIESSPSSLEAYSEIAASPAYGCQVL